MVPTVSPRIDVRCGSVVRLAARAVRKDNRVRLLFTTLSASGHFHPLVPIARAATDAGHTVAFACDPSFIPTVEGAGFAAFPAGFDQRGRRVDQLFPGMRMVPEYTSVYWVVPNIFVAALATTMVPDLLDLCRSWSPDLIVRAAAEYAGCVAAEVAGIPHASVRTGSEPSSYEVRQFVAAPLAKLRELNGLPPDPDTAMPFRYLHLACEPPGFVRPGDAIAPTAHLLRPVDLESGGGGLPASANALLDGRPTVYATLGTIFGRLPSGRATFGAILEALRDEAVNLIVTVGRGNDPGQFGPQPAHVHIAEYIPQGEILPRCAAVINQGGFSTITGTLNAGLPMVVIPIGADQPYNAACCAALEVGVVIEPDNRTPEAIRAAVRAVMDNPSYRQKAEQVRDEMAALPGPEHAVELLERLVVEKRPLRTASKLPTTLPSSPQGIPPSES